MSEFSNIQDSVLLFFATKMQKSDLFKIKEKVDKKVLEVGKSAEKDREKKQEQLNELLSEQVVLKKEALRTVIPDWLTVCANKAISVGKPIIKVSHSAKFSHGMIPYSGLLIESSNLDSCYLTTESLKSDYFDLAMSNGNLVSHGRFLMVNLDGDCIYEKLEKDDSTWLFEFSKNKEQVAQWSNGLKQWLAASEPIETSRLKQSYFPVGDKDYHLLSPLFSSTLCQEIYTHVRGARFDKENAKRKKARRDKKFMAGETLDFLNIAIMNFGGSQPQNITIGNFERHGEAHLLPCASPHWSSELQLPMNVRSLFKGEFDRRAWRIAKDLQRYLTDLEKQKSNMKTRNRVKYKVNEIIDVLLNYVAQIQNQESTQGWTRQATNLKVSHKLWLDPYREEQSFQDLRRAGDWQDEVCKDFGQWLNSKLENKKMIFEKIESKHWAKLLKEKLRELEGALEVKT